MYDRAPRDLVKTFGSTPQNVGPGSYDPALPIKARLKADGYAPFLSMTSRETFLNINDQVIAAPGPGHYDPAFAQQHVIGGKVIANKSRRFKETSNENPGPGAYHVEKQTDFRQSKSAPAHGDKDKGMGLVTSRIKFHRKPEAPSIPFPGQAFGYEECEDGTLKKQDAPDRDVTIGPAFYHVAHEPQEFKSTKTYKGVHFGKYTARRPEITGKVGPGPGEYEPYIDFRTRAENLNIMKDFEQPRFESHIPRYNDAIIKEEEKKAIPGPGKYDIKSTFDPQQPKVSADGMEVEHPPFLSQSKRFAPTKSITPAPGSYNDPRNALDITKRITGLKRSPFGQTSLRFQPESGVKKVPGPGAYNIAGMGSDSMRKAYIESTRKGVFGTTSVRTEVMTKKEERDMPGPAHYQVKEKPFKPRYKQLSSTFASVTTRLPDPPSTVKDIPPPGSYDVQKSYDHSQVKIERVKPRTERAAQKQGSFLTAASRFAPPRDIVVSKADADNPGPGAYDPKLTARVANLMVGKDKRFKELKSDTPGPGAYEFSPLIQDTVLHGTFNATLNNPIAPQQMDSIHTGTTAKHMFLLGM